jgi:hypothetical protein
VERESGTVEMARIESQGVKGKRRKEMLLERAMVNFFWGLIPSIFQITGQLIMSKIELIQ